MYTECPLCPFNEMNLPFQGSVTLLTTNHQQKRRIEKWNTCLTGGRNESWCIYSVSNETEWQQIKTNTEFTWELLSKGQILWCCGDVSLIWPIFQECQISNPLNALKFIVSISQSLTEISSSSISQLEINLSFTKDDIQLPLSTKFSDVGRKD